MASYKKLPCNIMAVSNMEVVSFRGSLKIAFNKIS